MSASSASLKHILLSYEEYERLKQIESEYHKLHSKIQDNLQLQGSIIRKSFLFEHYSKTLI
jgi:hypothetical protein